MMYLESRAVLQFSVLVGFAALFLAASIACGLFWQNDPGWIQSMSKAFRITTIFPPSMTFMGMSPWRGLLLTAVPIENRVDDALPTVTQLWARAKGKDY
jgi:hypothetical protein